MMFKNNIIVLLLATVLITFNSCTDIDDNFKDIIKNGEIEYSNKLLNLKGFNGNNRVIITGSLYNAVTVKEVVVTWNKGENSISFPYVKSENDTDELELIIPDLEEKSYNFKVFSKDSQGNKSISEDVFAEAFGATYQSKLEARSFRSTSKSEDELMVSFALKSSELERNTQFSYFDKDSGEEVEIEVTSEDADVILSNVDFTQSVKYRTGFVPDGEAIDEFYSEWVMYTAPQNILDLFSNVTISETLGGVNVTVPNPENKMLDVTLNYTVGGELQTTSTSSSDNPIVFNIIGLEGGEQEVTLALNDPSKDKVAMVYAVSPISGPEIVDFCMDASTWPAAFAFDGVINGAAMNSWHTGWQAPVHQSYHNNNSDPDLAHYYVIDYQTNYLFNSVEIHTDDTAFLKTVDVWVSNDDAYIPNTDRGTVADSPIYWHIPHENNWTKIGTLNFVDRTSSASYTLELTTPVEFRLIMFTMPDSHNTGNGNIRVSEFVMDVDPK